MSVNSSGKWDEEGHGQRTKPGEDQNTYTPVICPFTFLLTFPATTSSAKLCSLMSLWRKGKLVSVYVDIWVENVCLLGGIL